MAALGAWAAVVAAVAAVATFRVSKPSVRAYAWATLDSDNSVIVNVQIENRGAVGTTVTLGEIFIAWQWDDRPWMDQERHELVEWQGTEPSHRLPGRSGPVRWHAVCHEELVPWTATSGSAVSLQVGARRKPKPIKIHAKPPKEWTFKPSWKW